MERLLVWRPAAIATDGPRVRSAENDAGVRATRAQVCRWPYRREARCTHRAGLDRGRDLTFESTTMIRGAARWLVVAAFFAGSACSSSPLGGARNLGGGGTAGMSGGAGGHVGAGALGGTGSSTDPAADGQADAAPGTCLTIPPWPTPDPFVTSGAATAG